MTNDNILLPLPVAQKIARVLKYHPHGETWAEKVLCGAIVAKAGGYSFLQVEAMLGIWEAMLELRDQLPALDEHWEAWGTVEMRLEQVPILADVALAAWELLTDKEKDDTFQPYDWEFLPLCVRWNWSNTKKTLLQWLREQAAPHNNDHEDDGA